MIKASIISILILAGSQATVFAGEPAIGEDFPADFKERAFEHVVQLTKLGPRSPGADGEEEAFEYIRRQFEEMGLAVRVEEFDYETFKIEQMDFDICGEEIGVETIGFNPYGDQHTFGGEPLFVGPQLTGDELNRLELKNRIVVTTSPVDYFGLMPRGPRLIVYIGNSDFTIMAAKNCASCSLSVEGRLETHSSANIVAEHATRGSTTPDGRGVIISAHWDSYRNSPGADDNGSGVGVLLELARFFSTFEGDIGGTIKFVSFGAEELGVVGSRAYLDRHQEDLQNCILLFNMDAIGGPIGPSAEMLDGVNGIPEQKGTTQFPPRIRNRTFEGLDGRWRMIDPGMIEAFMVTNRPQWLVNAMETSAEQLGIRVRPTGNKGADQQVFTQAGIVTTSIGTSGNQHHGPVDVPNQINKDNLENVGKMVANVVLITLGSGMKD